MRSGHGVRDGSKGDLIAAKPDFRSNPRNGHRCTAPAGPVRATTGHARDVTGQFSVLVSNVPGTGSSSAVWVGTFNTWPTLYFNGSMMFA